MTTVATAPSVRRVPLRLLTLALGVALMASTSVGFLLAGDLSDAAGPASALGIETPRTAGSTPPTAVARSTTVAPPPPAAVGEAERIRAMDPAQVARSVASEDAAARPGSVPGSAVKGVWRVGAVGTYLVGKGIAPGTYESAGATQGSCQWSRLRDLSGKASSVIQRGSDSGTSVVTIRSSDAFFETSHCQNWHKIA